MPILFTANSLGIELYLPENNQHRNIFGLPAAKVKLIFQQKFLVLASNKYSEALVFQTRKLYFKPQDIYFCLRWGEHFAYKWNLLSDEVI